MKKLLRNIREFSSPSQGKSKRLRSKIIRTVISGYNVSFVFGVSISIIFFILIRSELISDQASGSAQPFLSLSLGSCEIDLFEPEVIISPIGSSQDIRVDLSLVGVRANNCLDIKITVNREVREIKWAGFQGRWENADTLDAVVEIGPRNEDNYNIHVRAPEGIIQADILSFVVENVVSRHRIGYEMFLFYNGVNWYNETRNNSGSIWLCLKEGQRITRSIPEVSAIQKVPNTGCNVAMEIPIMAQAGANRAQAIVSVIDEIETANRETRLIIYSTMLGIGLGLLVQSIQERLKTKKST